MFNTLCSKRLYMPEKLPAATWHNNCSQLQVACAGMAYRPGSTAPGAGGKENERRGERIMGSVSAINSASDIQMNYMKLLVTELQNQNPLEPLDNNQMASQLAQFSQLQQLESMDSNFANILAVNERTYANTLIGKEVSFMAATQTGDKELTTGTVDEVITNNDGKIVLAVGNQTTPLEDIISVKN